MLRCVGKKNVVPKKAGELRSVNTNWIPKISHVITCYTEDIFKSVEFLYEVLKKSGGPTKNCTTTGGREGGMVYA